jgi:hypothetical protein
LGVPNVRKKDQTMFTFWVPDAEAAAIREAVAYLDSIKPPGAPDVTISGECRRALRNTVKRAAGRPERAEKKEG